VFRANQSLSRLQLIVFKLTHLYHAKRWRVLMMRPIWKQ